MGVLPLQFSRWRNGAIARAGWFTNILDRRFVGPRSNRGSNSGWRFKAKIGEKRYVPVKLRIDTPIEIDYYRHGGILRLCCGNY